MAIGCEPTPGRGVLDAPTAPLADSRPTLAAIGVIAYLGETFGHEAIGHGGVCLMSGGRVTALAPLWMRCSVQTLPLVMAGPLCNFALAAVCAVALRLRPRSETLSYFLWLCCAFNGLVACGYVMVGGAAGFGDWDVIMGAVQPAWLWRATAVVLGFSGYLLGLLGLARLYRAIAGDDGFSRVRLAGRTLVPGAAAAVVACAAEVAGGHVNLGELGLALGCTLFAGWSLSQIATFRPKGGGAPPRAELIVPLRPPWIFAGAITAAAFIFWVGRSGT
jgi:hypothetical protein